MVTNQNITVARGLAIVVLATIQNIEVATNLLWSWMGKKSCIAKALLGADWTRREFVEEAFTMTLPLSVIYGTGALLTILFR